MFLDFPNKVIKESVQSTKYFPLENDLAEGCLASALQMSQAAKKELANLEDINEGIMDLTDDKVVKEYIAIFNKWVSETNDLAKEGKIQYGVVPYNIKGYTGGIYDTINHHGSINKVI